MRGETPASLQRAKFFPSAHPNGQPSARSLFAPELPVKITAARLTVQLSCVALRLWRSDISKV